MARRHLPYQLVAALACLAVQATTATALAAISFTVSTPAQSEVVGTSLSVSAVVNSTYAVQTVSAQVGTVMANLSAPSSAAQPWTGALAIGALPYGSQTLTITATDALGNTGSTTVSFLHHNPPVIQVVSPDSAVARPTISLVASCSDATGCLQQSTGQPGFEVTFSKVNGQSVTTNGNTLNQTIDLAAYDGQQVDLTFTATNSDHETTNVTRQVYVDTSTDLVPVATVPGLIFDFDATRILYRKADNSVVIRDRQTQADTIVGSASSGSTIAPFGVLTSAGAGWVSSDPPSAPCGLGSASAWYWNGGNATQFAPQPWCQPDSNPLAQFAGDWALPIPPAAAVDSPSTFTTINLVTGASVMHSFAVNHGNDLGWAVTSSGDVLLLAAGNPNATLYRDHGGTITSFDAGGPAGGLITDGTIVAFGVTVDGGSWLDLLELSSGMQRLVCASPVAYQVNGSWTACVQNLNGVNQVSSVSPSGTSTQLSIYNTNSSIDALGPTGEVMFVNGGDADAGVAAGRYLRMPPALPERINSQLGTAVARCDGWYIKMGGTLFQVSGTEDAGTGSCPVIDGGADGGAGLDAGEPSDASMQPDTTVLEGGTDLGGMDAESPGEPADGPALEGGQRQAAQHLPASGKASGGGGCALSTAHDMSGGWLLGVAFLVASSLARRWSPQASGARLPAKSIWGSESTSAEPSMCLACRSGPGHSRSRRRIRSTR
jgi:hypothetical protein